MVRKYVAQTIAPTIKSFDQFVLDQADAKLCWVSRNQVSLRLQLVYIPV